MIGQIVFVQYRIGRFDQRVQQTGGFLQTIDAVSIFIRETRFFQALQNGRGPSFAHDNGDVDASGHLTAKLPVIFRFFFAKLYHAGRDNDAPLRKLAQHFQRGLRPNGIGVERIVDDGEAPRRVHELQTILDGLKLFNAVGDLLQTQAQIGGDSRSQQNVLDTMRAQQTSVALNAAFSFYMQGENTPLPETRQSVA